MTPLKCSKFSLLLLVVIAFLSGGAALADKPGRSHGGKYDKHRKKDRHSYTARHVDHRGSGKHHHRSWNDYKGGNYFMDRDRVFIRDFYVNDFRRGFCPPGLAKKRNGCLPPGQAKKWAIGRPLPRDIVYYDLPPHLAIGLGLPPPGYRFVRVASDILMIAIGTGLVVDAIHDLGR